MFIIINIVFIIGANLYQVKVMKMMKNYDKSAEINHNPHWPSIPDHRHRILIISSSGSRKTNALLNLIKTSTKNIDKIYSYFKDLLESKYQLVINRREKIGIEKLKFPKVFQNN